MDKSFDVTDHREMGLVPCCGHPENCYSTLPCETRTAYREKAKNTDALAEILEHQEKTVRAAIKHLSTPSWAADRQTAMEFLNHCWCQNKELYAELQASDAGWKSEDAAQDKINAATHGSTATTSESTPVGSVRLVPNGRLWPAITTDSAERKDAPVFSGVMKYFPKALAAVAQLSKIGNDKHNPGQPLHWSREKSSDHGDCIARHQLEAGTIDTDGRLHDEKVAWRALAQLEIAIEQLRASGVKY